MVHPQRVNHLLLYISLTGVSQGAAKTQGFFLTVPLPMLYYQGVKAVIDFSISRELLLTVMLDLHVSASRLDRIAFKEPHSIGIYYKTRLIKGVE